MDNQNSNKVLIVLLTIFVVITILFGGYIIYDKLSSNNEPNNELNKNINNNDILNSLDDNISNNNNMNNNSDNNDIISSDNNNKYNYNLTKRTTIQALSEGYVEILVDTEGNTYLSLIGNLDSENDENLKNSLTTVQEKFKNYSPKNYISLDGEKSINAYKLNLENVLTAYYVHMGNGDSSYFIFIKEDGTLAYLDYAKLIYNGEVSLKNINNIQNIVSIVENTYSMTPYAISLDGTEIDLSNYIK